MVARSIDNFPKHLADIFGILRERLGLDRSLKFIDYYYSRYEPYGRSGLDWRLAVRLFDDINHVKRKGTRWYGCVGVGGIGKSTFMKNVFYFQDPTFNLKENVFTDWKPLIKKWRSFDNINTNMATLLDEPDEYAWNSADGKRLRQILGKARQGSYFFGMCATDVADMPPFIFRKFDAIFWVWTYGEGIYFYNDSDNMNYTVQEIKAKFNQEGYNILKYKRREGMRFRTLNWSPFDQKQEAGYIHDKKQDFFNSMDNFIGTNKEDKKKKASGLTPRQKTIIKMKKAGFANVEIAKVENITPARISQILKDLNYDIKY